MIIHITDIKHLKQTNLWVNSVVTWVSKSDILNTMNYYYFLILYFVCFINIKYYVLLILYSLQGHDNSEKPSDII